MPVKKNSSSAKKSTTSVKRQAKLVAPKGQKATSMKIFELTSPGQHLPKPGCP
jgi:hypothetical protein